jgi:hypothetical protein
MGATFTRVVAGPEVTLGEERLRVTRSTAPRAKTSAIRIAMMPFFTINIPLQDTMR